jgi:hypothetical protein
MTRRLHTTHRQATGLPITTDMAYCQYEFFGETFTTETVEQNTHNPQFDYRFIHHVDRCVFLLLRLTPMLLRFIRPANTSTRTT